MTLSSAGAMAFKRSLAKRARIDLRTLPAAIVAGVVGGLIVLSTSISYPAVIFTGAFEPYLGVGHRDGAVRNRGSQRHAWRSAAPIRPRSPTSRSRPRSCSASSRPRSPTRSGRAAGAPALATLVAVDRAFDPVARRGLHGARRVPAGQRDPLHPVPGDRGVSGLHRLAPAPRRDVDHGRSAAELVGKPPAPAAAPAAVLAARRARGHRSADPAAGASPLSEHAGRPRGLGRRLLAHRLAHGHLRGGAARGGIPPASAAAGAVVVAGRPPRRADPGRLGRGAASTA